jgi:hypothetical protein
MPTGWSGLRCVRGGIGGSLRAPLDTTWPHCAQWISRAAETFIVGEVVLIDSLQFVGLEPAHPDAIVDHQIGKAPADNEDPGLPSHMAPSDAVASVNSPAEAEPGQLTGNMGPISNSELRQREGLRPSGRRASTRQDPAIATSI